MWTCRLLHKSYSSAKLAAVSNEKAKLQSFVSNLTSSGQFSRLLDVVPYEGSSLFDFSSYFQHFSSITTEIKPPMSFGETLLIADTIPSTMKLLNE
ncbi:unnamed protein product [Rotaria magnacalcarata]|uniref:Uncharacterized protein n=2 Tax=Rotaria magnacalcarata TaxID=392030 RepID=A0A816YIX8_9BILA|nr:unnamed protein product [Rotaria magnacalcarata]CAF1637727.1 unnamed protein product [Rotaria magnacalcarata]CAF2115428.1 unnamed protein product [Rotaria magnacalcarata]CAF2160196.1 unnamed protein product [Rotaria magnacalcarata]CAF2192746.1 unnamed protein product [Rotaria magnacalcarata]